MTFGSLFAGIGGFDLGFERAGMECKWQVEIDPYSRKVLAKHWPNVKRYDDVRTFPTADTDQVDVISGGFPCQDISFAGTGAGLDGERSGLFFEVIRVARQLRPRIVVLENVAALLTRGLDRVLGTLAEIGYDAEWHCIPAAAVGAPHIRDRVFILAYSQCNGWDKRRTECEGQQRGIALVGTGASLADAPGFRCEENRNESRDNEQRKSTLQRRLFKLGRSDWWAVEPAMGRVADGIPARVDRLKGLGNAVVPQIAEYIGRLLIKHGG